MATIPQSGTNVRLLSNIPFSNDYKNTRWFDTKSEQTTYFQSKPIVHRENEFNYQRIEGQTFIRVKEHIDKLWGANYLMFQNAQYNNKWFYAFITKLEYENKQTTNVHFQIDVFQTWKFEMDFKPSYVVREHTKLWNSDGSPVINTVNEGLDYGTDYDVVETGRVMPTGGYKWLVIASKTSIGDGLGTNTIKASTIGTPQPLVYYVAPFKDNGQTPNIYIEKIKQGSPISGNPSDILETLYTSVSSVNDIVSVYVTDYIGLETTFDASDNLITFPDNGNLLAFTEIRNGNTDTNFVILRVDKVVNFKPEYHTVFNNKYGGFNSVYESKLLMYPYTVLQATDFKGNTTDFKIEYINDDEIRIAFKGSLGTSNYTSVNINAYNRYEGDGQRELTSNESALIMNNPNDVAILTDMLASYLQGNRNSLQNQKASIAFNGIMGAVGGAWGGAVSGASGYVGGGLGAVAGVGSAITGVAQGLGNMQLQLQGLQAKIHDINNTPPQVAKMGSNTAYDYGNGYNGVFFLKKQIKPEYIKKLRDYFNVFGYKLNEVKIPNFHTRKYWNYVQTASCVITGNFNNEDLNELKSVFDNGITFWHNDDVGNYARDNEVI